MAIYYINYLSDGSASNGTRAFDDASYTANDSYAAFAAAYAAASDGDTLIFSGGVSGHTYDGLTGAASKTLSLKDTDISGFDGEVTVDSPGSGNYTIGMNDVNFLIDGLTISRAGGLNTQYCVQTFNTGWRLNRCKIKDVTVGQGMSIASGDTGGKLERSIFDRATIDGGANNVHLHVAEEFTANYSQFLNNGAHRILIANNVGTCDFNNCNFLGQGCGSAQYILRVLDNNIANFKNSILAANGIYYSSVWSINNPSTLNTENCLIHGSVQAPHRFGDLNATGTWNSKNDLINEFPYFVKTSSGNVGYFSVCIDDGSNAAYFHTVADYAMDNYNIACSFFVSTLYGGYDLNGSASEQARLVELYGDGHEIGAHTRRHTDLQYVESLTVTYSGGGAGSVTVSSSGTQMAILGAGVSETWDLTSAPYDTIEDVRAAIHALAGFACVKRGSNVTGALPSTTLKDVATDVTGGGATNIPFDDDTGATNRYYSEEITGCIADIESAIGGDYVCQSFTFPYNNACAQVLTWIAANLPNIKMLRYQDTGAITECADLRSIDVHNMSYRVGRDAVRGIGITAGDEDQYITEAAYNASADSVKKARIEQGMRVVAAGASEGYSIHLLSHTTAEYSTDEWEWTIDEIAKYRTYLSVTSLLEVVNNIIGSGSWANSSGTTWTRDFGDIADYNLAKDSPCINAGVLVSGVHKQAGYEGDIDGNDDRTPYPNIGCYGGIKDSDNPQLRGGS